MTNKTKKTLILSALFILPLVLYIFLSTGINNFGRLPILSENIIDVKEIDSTKTVTFQRNISIVVFLGEDIQGVKGGFFNLNQKIYKPFYEFQDFQVVAIYPKDKKAEANILKEEIGKFTNMVKWKFVGSSEKEIEVLFESFNTGEKLNNLYSNRVYLIDKENKLRGRVSDKDTKGIFNYFRKNKDQVKAVENSTNVKLFGYNIESVGELNNKMKDDVKVLLAEYRLALKKNNADRQI